MTAKQHVSDSDDDSEQDLNEENPEEKNVELKFDSFNPWLLTNGNREVTPTADVECKTAGYRKFWEEKNKRCQEKPTDNGSNNLDENDDASTDNDSANLSKELNDLNRDEEMEVQTTHDPKTKFDDGTECNEEAEYMDEVDEIFDRLKTKNTANTKISPSSTEEADVDISKANLSSCTRELYNHREPQMKETTVRKRTLEDFDRPNMDDPFSLTNSKTKSRYFVHPVLSADKKSNDDDELASPDTSIDPRNFITVNPKVIKYRAPNLEDLDDDAIDDKCEDEVNAEHRMNIIEAFADDDVIEEFQ